MPLISFNINYDRLYNTKTRKNLISSMIDIDIIVFDDKGYDSNTLYNMLRYNSIIPLGE